MTTEDTQSTEERLALWLHNQAFCDNRFGLPLVKGQKSARPGEQGGGEVHEIEAPRGGCGGVRVG